MKLEVVRKPKTKHGRILIELLKKYAEEYEITSPVVEVNFYENYESYRKDFDYKLLKYFNFFNTIPLNDPYGQSIIFSVNPWFPQENDEICFMETNLSKFGYYESLEGIANLALSNLEVLKEKEYSMLDDILNLISLQERIYSEVERRVNSLRKVLSKNPYAVLMFQYENLRIASEKEISTQRKMHEESHLKMFVDSLTHLILTNSSYKDFYLKILDRLREKYPELDEEICEFEGNVLEL